MFFFGSPDFRIDYFPHNVQNSNQSIILILIEAEVLSIQRAGNGWVAQLVVTRLRRLDGELRGPLRGRGTPEVSGIVVNESLLLVRTGHHHVVLGTDGVRGALWHLDWRHDRTEVVLLVRTELAMVVSLLVRWGVEVMVVLLAPHRTDHTHGVLLALLVTHGTDGHVPGLAHALLLWRPHPELLGHERVGQYGALLQAVRPALAQHPLPPRHRQVGGAASVQRLDHLSQGPGVRRYSYLIIQD